MPYVWIQALFFQLPVISSRGHKITRNVFSNDFKTIFFLPRFDQIFEPGSEPVSDKAELMNRKVPLEMLIKAQDEPKITKEEENTVVLQVNHLINLLSHKCSICFWFLVWASF